ncbi:MAG: LysM domain-containing protein [Gammaproteobacteria bacterium]|nr:LysM domain-containing protein [Gammaproteobacteria bacterium]
MNTSLSLLFPPGSRYHNVETATFISANGKEIVYLKRRFVLAAERFTLLQEHFVVEGDRLDNITARYLNDPLQFWRICDANNAMNPPDLTVEIGRRLRITLPEGIPEIPNAAR